VEAAVGVVHRTEWYPGWDVDYLLTDGLRLAAKAGHDLGRVGGVLGVDATISPSPSRWTRSACTVTAAVPIALGPSVALEARVAGDVWASGGAAFLGGGLGLAVQR
jgi:hypothetical protein